MTHLNYKTGWNSIDQTENPACYIQFIDQVRKQDDAPEQYQTLFKELAAQAGEQILDVGCGTGGTTRALARQEKGIRQITGVDNSAIMIAEAENRAAGLNLPLAYQVADAHQLPFDENTFDRCYSIGVFEIIDQPQNILAEMNRVLHPGGRLVIVTGDIDASMIDAADKTVTRKIIHYACDYENNGWIGRQLPGYCHDLGLIDIKTTTRMLAITRYERWAKVWWQKWAKGAQAAGAISANELKDWLNDLQARDQAGKFFATWAGIIVTAVKPHNV